MSLEELELLEELESLSQLIVFLCSRTFGVGFLFEGFFDGIFMGESERKSCGTVFPIVGLTELSELSTIKWFLVSTVELSSKFTELLSLISGSSLSDGVSCSNPKEFGKLVTGSAKVLSETEALTFAGRLRSISGVGALSGSAKIVLL